MTLFLIPTPLGKHPSLNPLPDYVLDQIRQLDLFFVENVNSARTFLQWVGGDRPDYTIDLYSLTKSTPPDVLFEYISLVKKGRSAGILSEAGCPGVADPGAALVAFAHRFDVPVRPLVGPSSIILALMASGLNGQEFAFKGYLPRDPGQRKTAIRSLNERVRNTGETQIVMEAPQRNNLLLKELVDQLDREHQLAVACDLTLEGEWIKTMTVGKWRTHGLPDLSKKPALFLIGL